LTGSFEPFDESKARSCGADDFIAKPFESQQIIAKVTELCERAAARTFESAPESPTIAPVPAAPFLEQEPPPLPIQESGARPKDIWEAFTPEVPAPKPVFQPLNEAEESVSAPAATETSSISWVPVDEQAYSFEEETAATELPPPFSEPGALESPVFGEINFAAEIEPVLVQPEVEVIPVAEKPSSNYFQVIDDSSATFSSAPPQVDQPKETALEDVVSPDESAAPVAVAPAPVALTEDQLRAAIMAVSKDVIERIVWEVVPDLAETLIKEAIRRIKEGQ
jgi:hypothetical protein